MRLYLSVGHRVRVKRGPLEGVEGVIVEQGLEYKLVVSIRLLQQALAVDMEMQDVEPITGSGTALEPGSCQTDRASSLAL